jgi:hypothetical protein
MAENVNGTEVAQNLLWPKTPFFLLAAKPACASLLGGDERWKQTCS